jgi:hypothetical protein
MSTTTHTIEVTTGRNGAFNVHTNVWGQHRETFVYKTEKAAVRKVQQLERSGYELVKLPNLEGAK